MMKCYPTPIGNIVCTQPALGARPFPVYGVDDTPSITTVISSDAVSNQEAPFTLSIVFGEAVTGFTIDDIRADFALLSAFATSDNITFTTTVTPLGVSENIFIEVTSGVCVSIVGSKPNQNSNLLSLTQWNPTLTFGAFLDMELNFKHTLGKTLSGLESSVIDNLIAEGIGNVSWLSGLTGGNTIKASGDWAYSQGLANIESGDKIGRRYLHDGTVFELWYRIFLAADGIAYSLHLTQNNNGTSAKRGISLVLNVSAGNIVTADYNITNGGSVVRNQSSIPMTTVPTGGSWYTVRFTKTGVGLAIGNATYTLSLDAVIKNTGTNTGAITGTADSSDNISMFRTSSTTYVYSQRSLIKTALFITRALTAGEVTSVTGYLLKGREVIGSGKVRRLFLFAGQSLINGSTPSSNPPSDIRGVLQARMFIPTYRLTYSIVDTYTNLQYGVNNSYDSLTHFGPNLSFAVAAELEKPGSIFISQVARGGIPWYNQVGTDTTWSTANISALPRNSITFQWIEQALRIQRYQLNSTLKLYLYINEGQTDCVNTNPDAIGATQPDKDNAVQASIKLNCSNFIKKLIDDFQTNGIPTASLVIQIARMVSSFNPSTPNYTAPVNLAIDDIVANFGTDNPAYVGKYQIFVLHNTDYMDITGDGTHPNDASQVQQGETINTLFLPYY